VPLDRIKNLETSLEQYKSRPSAWEGYYDDIIGVTVIAENPIMDVKLTYSKPRGYYVMTKPLHHSQKCTDLGETIEIRLQVRKNPELIAKILSFGKDITNIEPKELADAVREQRS
jgi:predicted DNA-binding transcriptional regulator YafY